MSDSATPKVSIRDTGEKLGGARKDESVQTSFERPGAKLLDELWPAPESWRDLLAVMEPERAVLHMVLRGNVSSSPHPDGYHGKSLGFWLEHYIGGIQMLQSALIDPSIAPRLDDVRAQYYSLVGYASGGPRNELLRMLAIGKGHSRVLRNPFKLTPIDELRVKYLLAMGWATDPRVPDKFAYGAMQLLDRSTGAVFWSAVQAVSGGWKTLSDLEHPTEHAALSEAIAHAAELFASPKPTGQVTRPWQWQRPRLEGAAIRINSVVGSSQGRRVEELIDRFGIRGVEFGNWVPQSERQEIVDQCYDALTDLVALLGMPDRFASLGGRIGLGFGSRGMGLSAAVAHFEPGRWVVHLTRKRGAGGLAHEFAHAIDHFIAQRNKKRCGVVDYPWAYASQLPAGFQNGYVAAEDQPIFGALHRWEKRVQSSRFFSDARDLDGLSKKRNPYWGSNEELFARCIEVYLYDQLADLGWKNDYLVFGVDEATQHARLEAGVPSIYPVGQEREELNRMVGDVFVACHSVWTG